MKGTKPSIENFQFLLVSLMLILGGIQHGSYPIIGAFLISVGILIMLYALYNLIARRHNPVLKIFALFGEFVALIAAAYILYLNRSNYLHLVYLISATGIAVAIGVNLIKMSKDKRQKTW